MQCTGNSGCFPQGKRTAMVGRYPGWVFFSCLQCFRVSVIHRTLDMDCRIFNVRTWLFLCVCIHTGVGHTGNESAQHSDLEKLSQFFLLLRTGFKPLVFGSWVDALPIEAPHHPVWNIFYVCVGGCVCLCVCVCVCMCAVCVYVCACHTGWRGGWTDLYLE